MIVDLRTGVRRAEHNLDRICVQGFDLYVWKLLLNKSFHKIFFFEIEINAKMEMTEWGFNASTYKPSAQSVDVFAQIITTAFQLKFDWFETFEYIFINCIPTFIVFDERIAPAKYFQLTFVSAKHIAEALKRWTYSIISWRWEVLCNPRDVGETSHYLLPWFLL